LSARCKTEPRLRIRHHGVLVADIPNQSLTDDAPLYNRPVGTWKSPVPVEPSEEILPHSAWSATLPPT
jgi:phosphoribosylformylglycinamidine (FGAM) synthase-like enzyme